MNIDRIPIGLLFAAVVLGVLASVHVGFRLAQASGRAGKEKESPVSGISASMLGLLAFILAFTFGIVTDRYDARKQLVWQEANAISTAFLRSDILSEVPRQRAAELFTRYVGLLIEAAQSRDLGRVAEAINASAGIQDELWRTAMQHIRENPGSPMAALYAQALNEVFDLQSVRVAVGVQARIASGIWLVLAALIVLAMTGLGYQTAIAGSRPSWVTLVLALSFALVIALIVSLDRPQSGFITVSQQPLIDLQASMTRPASAPR